MENPAISKVFTDLANLLDLTGESSFKTQAYRKVAGEIKQLTVPITQLLQEKKLKGIPGVGEAIAKKITQLVTTGKMDLYEKVRSEFPQGVIDLMEVPGIGPKLAAKLYAELHIINIDELKSALWDGRVASLPRVGEKIAQNILRSIEPNR
jgi:DNA polymerase (family 10)